MLKSHLGLSSGLLDYLAVPMSFITSWLKPSRGKILLKVSGS